MSDTSNAATTRARQQKTGDDSTGAVEQQSPDAQLNAAQQKPDVSDQSIEDLLPKLLEHFHDNRQELARALGVHRSSVDRWLSGKSRPNQSTLLRMRGIAQEREIL